MKSKQLHTHQICLREYGSFDADQCPKITAFWEKVCDVIQHILGYKVPVSCMVFDLCNVSKIEETLLRSESDIWLILRL